MPVRLHAENYRQAIQFAPNYTNTPFMNSILHFQSIFIYSFTYLFLIELVYTIRISIATVNVMHIVRMMLRIGTILFDMYNTQNAIWKCILKMFHSILQHNAFEWCCSSETESIRRRIWIRVMLSGKFVKIAHSCCMNRIRNEPNRDKMIWQTSSDKQPLMRWTHFKCEKWTHSFRVYGFIASDTRWTSQWKNALNSVVARAMIEIFVNFHSTMVVPIKLLLSQSISFILFIQIIIYWHCFIGFYRNR